MVDPRRLVECLGLDELDLPQLFFKLTAGLILVEPTDSKNLVLVDDRRDLAGELFVPLPSQGRGLLNLLKLCLNLTIKLLCSLLIARQPRKLGIGVDGEEVMLLP